MTANVKLEAVDRRTVTLHTGGVPYDLEAVARLLNDSATKGYRLVACSTIEGGTQRDPIAIGVKLILERRPPDGI